MEAYYREVGNVQAIQLTENGSVLELNCSDSCTVRIWLLTDDIVRVRITFEQTFPPEESYTLLTTAWKDRLDDLFPERQRLQPIQPQPTATEEGIQVATKTLAVQINKEPFSLSFVDTQTDKCLHSDLNGHAYFRDALGRLSHRFRIDKEKDCFYGFGESAGDLNKLGRTIDLSPRDAIGHDPETASHMYKHIPLMIKTVRGTGRSCGIFYHSLRDAHFNLGAEISGYWPPFGTSRLDGGHTLDYFFINGPTMKGLIHGVLKTWSGHFISLTLRRVVKKYTDLTGKSVLPPIWSLGYQASSMFYPELPENCDQEISGFLQTCKDKSFPVDVFNLSSGYTAEESGKGKRNVLTWNEKRFPKAEKWIKGLRSEGIELAPNVKPALLSSHPFYHQFSESGAFVKETKGTRPFIGRWWGGPGSFVDFTNPEGREIWKKYLRSALIDKGVGAIWNDNNEYETVTPSALMDGEGSPRFSGELKNVQANMMSLVAREALLDARPHARPFVSCRSGSAGIQRYAQTWAGDNVSSWKALRFNIATILNLGLSGIANQGCDIGGFAGPRPSAQLLLRWVQNGIFQPRFSIHSCNNDNTVTEPWMYPQIENEIRSAIQVRYLLIPYFYSLVYEATQTGLPVMRPLLMEFPQDEACYNDFSRFFVGPSLLVANILEPDVTTHHVYLPRGSSWIRWPEGGEAIPGGSRIEIPVTNSSIPMFLPEGGILPLSKTNLSNLSRDKCTELDIFMVPPSLDLSQFEFYEDDGTTTEHSSGVFSLTRISIQRSRTSEALCIIIKKLYGKMESHIKNYSLFLHSIKSPKSVKLDGVIMKQFLNPEKLDSHPSGWTYDHGTCFILIKPGRAMSGKSEISVDLDHFDLIGMDL